MAFNLGCLVSVSVSRPFNGNVKEYFHMFSVEFIYVFALDAEIMAVNIMP